MKKFFANHFFVISLLLCFVLYWIFGDIIVFLSILAVIAFFLCMKGIYKANFLYFDLILLGLYLLLGFICLVFLSNPTVEILVIILGVWYIASFIFNKRL